jgi:fermentation-respiration switch protein FrsA (DUF1100 family)
LDTARLLLNNKGNLLKTLIYIILFYVAFLGVNYLFQDRLIFFPEKLTKNYPFTLPPFAKELTLKTRDGIDINGILYQLPANKEIVIYFHGNAGSLVGWKDVSNQFLALDYNFLIIDYRGYGKSAGTFSEKGFYADGEAAYEYAKKLGYQDNQIIFYGRSLGTGIAIEMAIRHPVKGLILETPFTNLSAIAMKTHWYLLPTILLRYKFNNLQKASALKIPVLILHGYDDELIPFYHSQKLNDALLAPHTLIAIPHGNHNNLESFPQHNNAIKQFLENLP